MESNIYVLLYEGGLASCIFRGKLAASVTAITAINSWFCVVRHALIVACEFSHSIIMTIFLSGTIILILQMGKLRHI